MPIGFPLSMTALNAGSVFSELWENFYNSFIANENSYENIDLNGTVPVQWIVIAIFVGIAIAAVVAVIEKRVHGAFVQKLIDSGCLSAEAAKTLPELDYADKLLIRYSVMRSVNLRRVVRCREEEEHDAKNADVAIRYEEMRKENPKLPRRFKPRSFRVRPDEHHFYIPEELKYTAEVKFDRKGTSLKNTVVSLILIAVALVVVIICLPSILNLVDGVAGMFKG